MSELREILTAQFARYPAMEPQDAVKLIYQNEFGGGHLVLDGEEPLARLTEEYRAIEKAPGSSLLEHIGNGFCRIRLQALQDREALLPVLSRLFVLGSRQVHGSTDEFYRKLELLKTVTEEGTAPFSAAELDRYLEAYVRSGSANVHHSGRYQVLYQPAYRVLPCRIAAFWPLFEAVSRLMEEKGAVLVAIDGMAAAGKTTLSDLLREVCVCAVVPMDHFFLPGELRTPERLAQPGGNVHYERFAARVTPFLNGRGAFSYTPFDCHAMTYAAPVNVVPGRLTVVEGAYSLHPKLGVRYDLRVFLTVDREEQKARILARNGPELAGRFLKEWIPMEHAYFEAFGIPEACDLVFLT